jgi:excinuclease ABC subunit C
MEQSVHFQHNLDPEKLRHTFPDSPGVYLFKDLSGRVIYVGKAKNLRKRVLSYFRSSSGLPDKTSLMMKRASGLDYLLTSTEKEAFILESNLIKKFMPRYNVILRDDKRYPCLRFDIHEPFPHLSIVRRIKKDGALYFGPFSSANAVRSTLKFIERIFPIRKCKTRGLPKRTRPCLNYEMGRCLGPCTLHVPVSKYREVVQQVRLFLEGRNQELTAQLRRKMVEAGEHLEFERAAGIRDQIRAIEKTVERQHVVSTKMEDEDIIGLARKESVHQLVILFVRKGSLMGSRDYLFKNQPCDAAEVMEGFLKQYYRKETFIPKRILISEPVEDLLPITEWLSDLAGHKIVIYQPIRGEKRRLVEMAVANAEHLLNGRWESQKEDLVSIAQTALKLKMPPHYIEGLDISNLQGNEAVGSIVSFVDGLSHKSGYRNYRMKVVNGIDDYGMMAELVERRVSKGHLPDLFLVDGGKGHLAVVKKVLDRKENPGLPEVISIAKQDKHQQEKHDKIYIPERKNPIRLGADHPVLLLMMRIRDEAHRRAITYHRKLRGKHLKGSELDLIPGIGVKRKKILLTHFKDIRAIADATAESLVSVQGINRSLAERIFSFFQSRET